jgi:hypothetical protein
LDFLLWATKEWHDKAGLSGYYFDNTMARKGWVYSQREYLKRLRTYFLQVGPAPVLNIHMTDAPMIGTLGFADSWMDGENGGYIPEGTKDATALDHVDCWGSRTGLVNLRITLGRQWGTMPTYLYNFVVEPSKAVLGLFDLEDTRHIPARCRYDFDIRNEDCRFIPYWDSRKPVLIAKGGPDILTAAWARPERVRVLVSNLSSEDRAIDLSLDCKILGLPAEFEATDEDTGEALSVAGASIKSIPVTRHGRRALLLAKPGIFPAMVPPPDEGGKPIAALCDDFARLDGVWTKDVSAKVKGADGPVSPAIRLRAGGELELYGAKGSALQVRRAFGEDNCSVQVRIRGAKDGHSFAGGHGLCLYWGKERYVRIAAPEAPSDTAVFLVQAVGAKAKFAAAAGAPIKLGMVNWGRITLKPDVIEFHGAPDGGEWRALGTLPRAGLDGAPPWLILGQGVDGAAEYLMNDGICADNRAPEWCSVGWFSQLKTMALPGSAGRSEQ